MAQTWRIGIFKNEQGRLVTVYTDAAGNPVPYEMKKVGNNPLLITGIFSDMKYSEARAALLKQAEAQGISGEVRVRGQGPPRTPRAPREPGAPVVNVMDDIGVPTLASALYADGWRSRILMVGHNHKDGPVSASVFIAPDQTEYVKAGTTERADLIFLSETAGRVRLRNYNTSGLAKRAEKSKAKADGAVQARGLKSRRARG